MENKLKKTLLLYKKVGQTPLEVIEDFKNNNPEYADEKMSYAGRLDPMAEGKLLVLVGEECKQREKYLGLDKEYEFEILVGFKSDSLDVLGLAKKSDILPKVNNFYSESKVKKALRKISKIKKIKYPVFSSKTVDGKPLFMWALEDKLDQIEIPERDVKIFNLKLEEIYFLEKKYLEDVIFRKINSIKEVTDPSKELGKDFRRGEIRKNWKRILAKIPNDRDFMIIRVKCLCSSGTYMRALAEMIANELGNFGLAFSIKRTRIGRKRMFGFKDIVK